MAYETLRYDLRDGVATIALDQPETRNALSDQLLGELIEALEQARADEQVRAVVLASTHERIFSAGANLGGFAAEVPLIHKHFATERFPRVFRLLGELGKPSLCAASGHVLAGALGIALACDLVIAKDSARFGTPEINVGLFPFMIMALIYRNVPRKKVAELMLLGEQISAAEAERIGLVNRVAPAEDLQDATQGLVDELMACAPVAVGLAKRVLDASARPALSTTLELEVALQERCAATEDFAEGARALRDKRQPEFAGR
jgi:enoyl-CoA hydratase/carnithine racemase